MAQVKSESYLDVAPELIVEILSPGDRWDEVNDKLTEYFAIGVQMVWVVDPKRKQFHLYRALTEVEILTAEDDISGGEVLSGFSVGVAELFGTAS
jgi:Uma2 family endonuclease